jgi:hypothetical protein
MPGMSIDPATADRRKPRREQEQSSELCMLSIQQSTKYAKTTKGADHNDSRAWNRRLITQRRKAAKITRMHFLTLLCVFAPLRDASLLSSQ